MTIPHLLPCVLAAALAAVVPAQADAVRKALTAQFTLMDLDKDGVLVRKEFAGSDPQFAAIDKDGDKKATLAEFLASEAARGFARAAEKERGEPRPRLDVEPLLGLRLQQALRADQNRDGRVQKSEWNGAELAFAQLDLDRDGDLDRDDRDAAAAAAARAPAPLPELKGDLPSAEELVRRLDKDGDQKLGKRELAGHKALLAAIAQADRDGDQALDRRELEALLAGVQARRAEAERSTRRQQAYAVPFDEWDKDKDDKIQQNEWMAGRPLFERIDLDRDAALSRIEVARYKKRVEGEDFVARFDLDGDGKVTLAEFGGPADPFRRADKNGDGFVTRGDR
jgi:Ca2+-binding EF-hand superfamily protein